MRYVFDLDGTICEQTSGGVIGYFNAKPIKRMVTKVRQLYLDGHVIVINTARGMSTATSPIDADIKYRNLTEVWLKQNDVPYHQLTFGKPAADVYVDDKAINATEFVRQIPDDPNERYFLHNVEFGSSVITDVPDLRKKFCVDDIIMTNGCFDVFHAGHASYLAWIRDTLIGDNTLFVIAVNSDQSVKRLKGHTRPVMKLEDRVNLLLCSFPSAIVIAFGSDTPLPLMDLVKPNVVVKSTQYFENDIVRNEEAIIMLAPHYQGLSSTNMVEKIKHHV